MSAPSLTKHLGPLRRRLSPSAVPSFLSFLAPCQWLPSFPPLPTPRSPTQALYFTEWGGHKERKKQRDGVQNTTDRYLHNPAPGEERHRLLQLHNNNNNNYNYNTHSLM